MIAFVRRNLLGSLELLRCGGGLGFGLDVIQGEEAAQDFFAGGGANCVANAAVLGKCLDLVEVVTEIEVLPFVGVPNCDVEAAVQPA